MVCRLQWAIDHKEDDSTLYAINQPNARSSNPPLLHANRLFCTWLTKGKRLRGGSGWGSIKTTLIHTDHTERMWHEKKCIQGRDVYLYPSTNGIGFDRLDCMCICITVSGYYDGPLAKARGSFHRFPASSRHFPTVAKGVWVWKCVGFCCCWCDLLWFPPNFLTSPLLMLPRGGSRCGAFLEARFFTRDALLGCGIAGARRSSFRMIVAMEPQAKIQKLHDNGRVVLDSQALRVKKLSACAVLPSRGSALAAGYDLSRCALSSLLHGVEILSYSSYIVLYFKAWSSRSLLFRLHRVMRSCRAALWRCISVLSVF